MANKSPSMPPKRRVVLCMGVYCNRSGRAEPFHERLCQAFGDPGPAWATRRPQPVKWEIATCLSMCGAGPNLVIYPDDTIYNRLDTVTLERIIEESLREADSLEHRAQE